MNADDLLSIGQVADRLGVAVSAIRFYEDKGLVSAERSATGQRRFQRSSIRRLSFLMVAQRLGYSLAEIGSLLAELPEGRAPNEDDWERIGTEFRAGIDRRITELQALGDKLSACIGCGCLSLARCHLYNKNDTASSLGDGPRFLFGDSPVEITPEGSE